jgi:predicted P-loop ATPase
LSIAALALVRWLLVTRGHPSFHRHFAPVTFGGMADLYRLSPALFVWANKVLRQLRLDRALAVAKSIEEVLRITLNDHDAAIILAIRDALHPAKGHRQKHFRGLKENDLRQILKNQFVVLKENREEELRGRRRNKASSWTDRLLLNRDGKITPNLANLILILREAPPWQGVLGYDEFAARVVIRKHPPWGDKLSDAPWTDHHESLARVWFQRDFKISPSAGDLGRAVQAAARQAPFHPVRDYLGALVWDGTLRLDTWLVTYFHSEDTPYIRVIGPRCLISAVARIYQPGCQADHVPVFEGPQGKYKSTALRTLAVKDAWFADRLSHVSSKDAAQETAGVWFIELAELDALFRATAPAMKSYISRRYDRYRPSYGKHITDRSRQCVFAGTYNPPPETHGRYLKDSTGARRIWPVACHGTIDLAGLKRDRDQLWAEVVVRYRAGAKWHLETPELEVLATAEQAARFVIDPWEDDVRDWIGDRVDVGSREVLEHVLGLATPAQQTDSAFKRVAGILTRLGFKKCKPRAPEGRREHRYRRDPPFTKKMTD